MDCLSAKDVVSLIQVVAWPLVALLALIYFRKPLENLVAEIPRRASKITVFNFSIELAKVQPIATNWHAGNADIRRLTRADMFDSNTADLIQQISSTVIAEYAVIDLGDGRQWLTSRLFLIADLLDRMRSLNCLVFVRTHDTTRPVFLGLAHPRAVRWRLAQAYPPFEVASVNAYSQLFGVWAQPFSPGPLARQLITSQRGALSIGDASGYLRNFLDLIQQFVPPTVPTPPPPAGYVELEGPPNKWEYAEWVNPQNLGRHLGDALSTVSFEDSPDLNDQARIEGLLRRTGSYVALVDHFNFFKDLVDRKVLLEKAIADAVKSKPKDSTTE